MSGLGRPRLHHRLTDSTNARARELARRGAPHGTLVTAAEQSAGRARQGRTWSAPPGSSLLMSLIVRWSQDPAAAAVEGAPGLLPLLAGVAVCDAAAEPSALIKWPNDVVLPGDGGRLAKLAGILVEGRPQEGWAVVGIGVNVAVELNSLPAALHGTAATLGRPPEDVEPMLEELLRALERRLALPSAELLEAWSARDALRGRRIGWGAHGVGESISEGVAQGVDGTGRLIVALDGGGQRTLEAGEVHLAALGAAP